MKETKTGAEAQGVKTQETKTRAASPMTTIKSFYTLINNLTSTGLLDNDEMATMKKLAEKARSNFMETF